MDETPRRDEIAVWKVGDHTVDTNALTISGPDGTVCVEPMVMSVLVELIDHAGNVVSRADLLDRVWKAEYGSDERLTRAISLLRKALGDSHGIRKSIETVPKRGYRLIAPVERAVIASHDPGNRPADPSASSPRKDMRPVRGNTLVALAVAIIGVGLVGLAAAFLRPSEPSAPETAPDSRVIALGRIEVGAFQTASTDPVIEALARSMPANMTAILSEAGIETAAMGAASDTSAEFRVRGQVQTENGIYRAYVELYDTLEGVVIWSDTFERDAAQRRDLSRQVGANTAWIMRCALGVRGDNTDAPSVSFRRYARFCRAIRDPLQMKNVPAFTQDILNAEPERPTAMALHAWATAEQAQLMEHATDDGYTEMLMTAQTLAQQALDIDPENAFANFALATTLSHRENIREMTERLEKANEGYLSPAPAVAMLAHNYRIVGRISEARLLLARALAVDPFDVYARTQYALMQALLGNKEQAHRQLDRVARENPDWKELYSRKLQIELFSGDAERGLAYLDEVIAGRVGFEDDVLACARVFGEQRLAETPDIEALEAACPSSVQADWRARMFAALGDLDRAYAAMGEFPTEMLPVTVVFFYPEMDAFRRDERFWPMANQFGLVDYWLDTNNWPDFCYDESLPYDCRRIARQTRRSTTIQ